MVFSALIHLCCVIVPLPPCCVGDGFLSAYTVFYGMSYIVLILIALVSLHVSFVFVML